MTDTVSLRDIEAAREVVADVAQFMQGHQPERVLQAVGVVGRPDERPASAPAAGLDQAHRSECGERLAKGHRRDAELPGQLALGREAFPVEQQAQPDRVGQPPGHSIGTAAGVERREQGACAYGRKRRWCHECPLPRTRVRAHLHVLDTNIWSCRLSESSIPGPRFAHGVVPA